MNEQDSSGEIEQAVGESDNVVIVRVRAQPGARRHAVTGVRDGEICIAVNAAPDKGKANDAITRLLAKTLGVARGRVELIAGPTNRHKRFAVSGADLDEVRDALRRSIPFGH